MTTQNSSSISANSDKHHEEWLNQPDEENRGIYRLEWQIPVDVTSSAPPRHESTTPLASLTESTSRRLRNWLAESPGSASNILWLSGVPPSFNSDDINALCQGNCLLAASFSFSTRKGSDQAIEIVPTLALQISSSIPSLRRIIGLTAFHYPEIFSESLDVQLEALVFNPFRQYSLMKEHTIPAILVIDGLELYHDLETQKSLISSIEMVATTSCIPLRFLMISRQGSQEYGLPLESGTHLHVHNGPKAPRVPTLQSPFSINPSPKANTSYYGFPQLLQTQSTISEAESYTRSLIMLGHGVPLWRPRGNLSAPAEYLQQGPQIGDIMYITREGEFRFLVNIFRSHEDPINRGRQGRYASLTLDPSEVTRVENFFKPGSVITSTGVIAVKQCDAPLTLNFKSNTEEGAVLVLPDGASREDIASTKHLHKYVQRWAPYWYKYRDVPNGSIFIVTGCDKASDFACATFSSNPSYLGPREIDMDYVKSETDDYPWNKEGRARAHHNRHPNPDKARRFCVFVRGMRIALASAVWSSYNTSLIARNKLAYTNVLHKSPLLGHATESLLVRLHCRPRESKALRRVSADNNIFHPIFALGPDLFNKYPKASVVVINDSDWSSLTQQGHGDWTHMKALIDQFYRHFAVVEENGVVYLSRKAKPDRKDMSTSHSVTVPRLFRRSDGPVKMIPVTKLVHDLGERPDT